MGAVDRSRLIDLVDRRGTSPLSFLIRYEAPWQAHWHGDGAVPYLEGKRAAVVWSDPLCEVPELPALLRSFDAEMRRQRRGTCLIAVGEDTARAALEIGYSVLKVGEDRTACMDDLRKAVRLWTQFGAQITEREQPDSRFEIGPFDRAFHIAPRQRWSRNEITVNVKILHRNNVDGPVNDSLDRCLNNLRAELKKLCVHEGVWQGPTGGR